MTKELSEKELRFAKYKWEFLRRNPKYIEEWEELWAKTEGQYKDGWTFTAIPMNRETADFCEKWGVSTFLYPHNSFSDMVKSFEKTGDKFNTEKWLFSHLFSPFGISGKMPVMATDGWEYPRDGETLFAVASSKLIATGNLNIELNLNYSKKRLMDELKSLVDEWKELYEKAYKGWLYKQFHGEDDNYAFSVEKEEWAQDLAEEMQGKYSKKGFERFYKQAVKNRQSKYRKKYHFDNFDIYLQVWDLKERENLSWNEIANRLFPNDINGKDTARNHHKAALRIIEKGVELYGK